MNKIKIVIAMFAVLLMISGADLRAEDSFEKESQNVVSFPDTSTWILTRIGGTKAKQHTGNKVFITMDKAEKKVSGYTSCNYIRGQFSIKDTTLAFSGLSFGKRECDEATTELEKTLLDAFQKITSWKIENNILHLYDKGVLILEFKNANTK